MTEATENSDAARGAAETAELAQRVCAGDRSAFQQLYERVVPGLYAWAHLRAKASGNARLDPQDLVQEVWLRALHGIQRYDPSRSFRAWILGITKNVLLQSYRNSQHERVPLSEAEELIRSCPASVTSISTRLAKDDAIQHFLEYVSELPDVDRLLVLYCGLEEYTSAQAAVRLGISADAANKRWQTLRARLREIGALQALALEDE